MGPHEADRGSIVFVSAFPARARDTAIITFQRFECCFGEARHSPIAAPYDPRRRSTRLLLRTLAQGSCLAFEERLLGADPTLEERYGVGTSNTVIVRYRPRERPEQVEYVKWNAFRDSEDARFVGLTLPRVLMRSPWADDGGRSDGFRFREEFRRADAREHLWGNACYAFGAVLVRAFSQNGWLADIRGVVPGQETGGLVTGLPTPSFPGEKAAIAPRSSTDATSPSSRRSSTTPATARSWLCRSGSADVTWACCSPPIYDPAATPMTS